MEVYPGLALFVGEEISISYEEFGDIFNVSKSTIENWIKDIRARQRGTRDNLFVKLSLLGWTQQEIAKKTGLKQPQVSEIIDISTFGKIVKDFQNGQKIEKLAEIHGLDLNTTWASPLKRILFWNSAIIWLTLGRVTLHSAAICSWVLPPFSHSLGTIRLVLLFMYISNNLWICCWLNPIIAPSICARFGHIKLCGFFFSIKENRFPCVFELSFVMWFYVVSVIPYDTIC